MCQKHVRKVLTSVDYPGVITDDMPETTVMEVSQGSCGTDAQYRTLNTTYPNGQIESTVEITGEGIADLQYVPYSKMNNLIVNEGGVLTYYCGTVCQSIDVTQAKIVVVAYQNDKAVAIGVYGTAVNLAA